MGSTLYWIFLLLLNSHLYFITSIVCSRIELTSNSYRDIIVSLPTAAPRNREHIIEAVKELFDYSSRVLYVATKRRVTFKSIILLTPNTWSTNGPSWTEKTSSFKNYGGRVSFRDADIIISDSLQRKSPYTLQANGCGQRGIRIYLPTGFLLSDRSVEEKSIEFVHYWSQYRYGVFPEGGFFNDARYPLYYGIPGASEILVTSCTNSQSLSYNATNHMGGECDPEVNYQTGKIIAEECQISPIFNDDELASSIMYQQGLPQISRFCDSDWSLNKRHVPSTPSKHNALCFEEGTWFVILKNEDFAKGKNLATKYKPEELEFNVFQQSHIRVVLAVDVSSKMGQKGRHSLVKHAFTKFVLFDLPLGTELGTVYFADDIKIATPNLTLLDTEVDKFNFLENSPFYDETDESRDEPCLECALNFSIKLLQRGNETDGVIVLILGSPNMYLINNKKDIETELYEKGIRLEIIHFSEVNDNAAEFFSPMTMSSISIPEMDFSQTEIFLHMSLSSSIANVFLNSDDNSFVFMGKLNSSLLEHSLAFNVDKSVARDLAIIISGPTFTLGSSPLVEDVTFLTSSNQERFPLQKEGYIPAWKFSISCAKIGMYVFATRRKEGRSDNVFVSVFGKPLLNESHLTLNGWTDVEYQRPNVPVKIFAELRYGVYPVYGAKVSAVVYDPNNKEISNFVLNDNGLGDPDVTRHDGIYSKYFTQFSVPGYYSILIRAEGTEKKTKILHVSSAYCCGSIMPIDKTEEVGAFSRLSGPFSFYLFDSRHDNGYNRDVFPPNRILDLAIASVDVEHMTYILTWTSAGDDYDNGIAEGYKLKIFPERGEALRRFDDTGIMLNPNREIIQHTMASVYGVKQEYYVKLPDEIDSGHYFFAVKAIDNANNSGKVSNIVEVLVRNIRKKNSTVCEDENGGKNSAVLYSSYTIFVYWILIFMTISQILNRVQVLR